MVTLEELETRVESGDPESLLLPPDAGLADWPVIALEEDAANRFSHGNPVVSDESVVGPVRVFGARGKLLGLGELEQDKQLKPKRIFNL